MAKEKKASSAAKKTTVKKPVTKKTDTKKPAAKKPAVKKPMAKKSTAKKATAKKPNAKTTKKPAVKKPDVKKTTAKKPAAKTTKKPTVKKTTSKKSAPEKTPEQLAQLYWQESRHEDLASLSLIMLEETETRDSPFWLNTLSESYCLLGIWDEVIEVNKKRTALFPDERGAWDVLAIAHAVLGDYNSAAAALITAEDKMNWDIPCKEPDLNEEPSMRSEFYNAGKEGDPSSFSSRYWERYSMYTLYPKILKNAPQCAAGWYTLAKFYGDDLCYYDDAVPAIEKAIALKPDWKPALAYHVQMLSFIYKTNFEDNYYLEQDQTNEERNAQAAAVAKVEEAYERWDKEKAHAYKLDKKKYKEHMDRLTCCEKEDDYHGIVQVCEDALKNEKHIELIINPFWLYKQCEAYISLEQWDDVVRVCEKRLELIKQRRAIYDRYDEGYITDEEKAAFRFLDGTDSELYNSAWNNALRQLHNEEENSKSSLENALKKLK